jgi:uncharacterized protein (TIGR00255 family)
MTLQSMTGFARAEGDGDGLRVAWELRSVNGKGLDLRLRLPPGFERLEQPVRQAAGKRFTRGSIQAALTVSHTAARSGAPAVNEPLLRELAALAARLVRDFDAVPASADGLLALPGVLDAPQPAEKPEMDETTDRLALDAFERALDGLLAARRAEGAALAAILGRHVDAIERLSLQAEADPSREPAAVRERLTQQVRVLLEAHAGLDEARLAQEAALLASRADIREEIDRLRTHCAAARDHLAAGGAVGRRLDFLAQEFNREANTLCSKSNAASVTAIGLELKAVVDQFREQVQNLE